MAPRGPKMAPRWSQDGPERLQDGPKRPQDGPKRAQDGPNRPQDASPSKVVTHLWPTWTPKGAPRTPQDGPLGPPKSDDVNKDSALFHISSYVEARVEDGMAQDRIRGPMRHFGDCTLGPRSSLWRGIKGEVDLPLGRGKGGDIEVTRFLTRHEPLARRISK